jgi:hypothetical protein
MGTTPNGYPYPEDTDLESQGAQAIKALANKVDTQLRITASGTATIIFPVGRFTATPAVAATCEDGNYFTASYSRTPTGARVYVHQYKDATVTGSKIVSWIASL